MPSQHAVDHILNVTIVEFHSNSLEIYQIPSARTKSTIFTYNNDQLSNELAHAIFTVLIWIFNSSYLEVMRRGRPSSWTRYDHEHENQSAKWRDDNDGVFSSLIRARYEHDIHRCWRSALWRRVLLECSNFWRLGMIIRHDVRDESLLRNMNFILFLWINASSQQEIIPKKCLR